LRVYEETPINPALHSSAILGNVLPDAVRTLALRTIPMMAPPVNPQIYSNTDLVSPVDADFLAPLFFW
jgi:hypothetical protein